MKLFNFILFIFLISSGLIWWSCSFNKKPPEIAKVESSYDEVDSDDEEDDSRTDRKRRRRRRSSSSNRSNNNDGDSDGDDGDNGGSDGDNGGGDGDNGDGDDGDDGDDDDDGGGDGGDSGRTASRCEVPGPGGRIKCDTRNEDNERIQPRQLGNCQGNLAYLCGCSGSTVRQDCSRQIPSWLCDSEYYGYGNVEILNDGSVLWHTGRFQNGTWEGGIWRGGGFYCSTWKRGEWRTGVFRDSVWQMGTWTRGCIENNGQPVYNDPRCGSDRSKCICLVH